MTARIEHLRCPKCKCESDLMWYWEFRETEFPETADPQIRCGRCGIVYNEWECIKHEHP